VFKEELTALAAIVHFLQTYHLAWAVLTLEQLCMDETIKLRSQESSDLSHFQPLKTVQNENSPGLASYK
jgi:hypothetical protein